MQRPASCCIFKSFTRRHRYTRKADHCQIIGASSDKVSVIFVICPKQRTHKKAPEFPSGM